MIKKLIDNTQRDEIEVTRRKLSQLACESNWRELTSMITSLRRENKIESSLQPPDGDGRTCLWVSFYENCVRNEINLEIQYKFKFLLK